MQQHAITYKQYLLYVCVCESCLVLAGPIHKFKDSMSESDRCRLFTAGCQLPWRRIERPAVVTMNGALNFSDWRGH